MNAELSGDVILPTMFDVQKHTWRDRQPIAAPLYVGGVLEAGEACPQRSDGVPYGRGPYEWYTAVTLLSLS